LRLKIGKYEIPQNTLTSVVSVFGTPTVNFSGMVHGGQGPEIVRELEKSAKENTVPFEITDVAGNHSSGKCRLFNLKIEEITTSPRLIIYSGELIQSFTK